MADYQTNELQGFLRLKQVAKLVPIGESTIWARVASGEFPQPIKLGPRTTVWYAEDIYAYIESFRKKTKRIPKSHPDRHRGNPPAYLNVPPIHGVFTFNKNPDIHNIDESLPPFEDQLKLYKEFNVQEL